MKYRVNYTNSFGDDATIVLDADNEYDAGRQARRLFSKVIEVITLEPEKEPKRLHLDEDEYDD